MATKTFSLQVVNNTDEQPFESGAKEPSFQRLVNQLKGFVGGTNNGTVTCIASNDAVAGSTTLTLTSCLGGTVIEINGVEFTALTSGIPVLGNGEFSIASSDAAGATSLAAAINASTSTSIASVLTASSTGSSGVVTLTSVKKGYEANAITVRSRGVMASTTGTCASVVATDTMVLNGSSQTAIVQSATGTLTAATAVAGNTFSVKGHLFTGAAGASTTGAATFSIDSTDAAVANDIVKQINGYVALQGVVTATSTNSTGVVTIRACTPGTGGNAIGLTGTVTKLAASAATLANGIAVANAQFDSTGNNAQVAADLARCINANTTAATSAHVLARATCGGTLACTTAIATNAFTLNVLGVPYRFVGVAGAAKLGTLTFSIDTGNTETATSIAAQVNAYAPLAGLVTASSSTSTATIRALTTAVAKSFLLRSWASTIVAALTGVVTFRSKYEGLIGNYITSASTGGTITVAAARLAGGTVLSISDEGTPATGTLTCASVLNTHTVLVNGVTLTAHTNADDVSLNQFRIDGTDAEDATALARAINLSASAGLREILATTTGLDGVVTLTARKAGTSGNTITTVVGTGGTITVQQARLATGAIPTTVVTAANTRRLTSGAETAMTFTF